MYRDVLAIVLAGGRGSRLEPLTRDRAKPAVPFGGIYRIIDFTLSNCINSDLRKMLVLTQYKATSLNRHIDQGWKFLCRELDEYIEVIPPQQRIAEMWYQGTADAIYQNVYTIEKAAPRDTMILAGDHIYKMNYARMIDVAPGQPRGPDDRLPAGAALEGERVRRDGRRRRRPGDQLPREAEGPAGHARPARAGAGLDGDLRVQHGRDVRAALPGRGAEGGQRHDFGRDIIPAMIAGGSRVFAYPFRDENRKRRPTGATWGRSTPISRRTWT